MELGRIGKGRIRDYCDVIDTVKLAKQLLPGKAVSLDSLCRYYEIDNSSRTFHGALLDAQLLAEVYLSLSRGQDSLSLTEVGVDDIPPIPKPDAFFVLKAKPEELAEHERILGIADKSARRSAPGISSKPKKQKRRKPCRARAMLRLQRSRLSQQTLDRAPRFHVWICLAAFEAMRLKERRIFFLNAALFTCFSPERAPNTSNHKSTASRKMSTNFRLISASC